MTDGLPDAALRALIENELANAGLQVAVESSDGALVLNGVVDTEEARQAASDIAGQLAPRARIDNQLEVETILPTNLDDFVGEQPSAELSETGADIEATGGELEPDFTDQFSIADPEQASGASNSNPEDPASEGDAVYAPPIDPVVTTDAHGSARVLGGFGSGEEVEVESSASDGRPGDEALADAVRRELAEDAATAELSIFVLVRNGIAHLRGQVADLDDADNAESVAARVPGIREVLEELEVSSI
ncbi:MAG: BON domain-containing protein [Chloroflexota bacterium]|nr:BON domain-containing protein [Chloroflexota bacterium]